MNLSLLRIPVSCILILSSCFFSSCEKDPPIPEMEIGAFQKNYGGVSDDHGYAVAEGLAGDLYIAGYSSNYGALMADGLLMKTDQNGNLSWAKVYGGAGIEMFREIITTNDGNLLMVGISTSFSANSEIYIVKADTAGNMIWEKNYGGAPYSGAEDVLQHPDGSFLIAGTRRDSTVGFHNIYIMKLNALGDTLWTKTYGDTLADGGASIALDNSGNIMLLAYTDNYGSVNRDLYLMKLNSNGDSLNSWLYGSGEYEEAQSIEKCSDGNFIIFGHTAGFGHIEHNTYALKVDPNGSILWERNYGGVNHDGGEHGKQSSDGGYIFAGRTSSFGNFYEQTYLFKTDASGNMTWQKDIGGSRDDNAYNMIETATSYITVGSTNSITNGNNDVFLVKIPK